MAGKNEIPSGLISPRPPAAVAGVAVVAVAAWLPDLAGDGDPVEAGLVPLLAAVDPRRRTASSWSWGTASGWASPGPGTGICPPVSMIFTLMPILAASSVMAACSRSRSTWPGVGG